jgi:predicted RNase H-like HicB family nuclease
MRLTVRLLREADGQWIADVTELPGVATYGQSQEETTTRAKALALRGIAEVIEHGEMKPPADSLHFSIAA